MGVKGAGSRVARRGREAKCMQRQRRPTIPFQSSSPQKKAQRFTEVALAFAVVRRSGS